MILKKDILEKAFENYKEQNEKVVFQDFPKMVVEGMRMLKENYEAQEQGLFISRIRNEEEDECFFAAMEYNELLPKDDPAKISDGTDDYDDDEEYDWDDDDWDDYDDE